MDTNLEVRVEGFRGATLLYDQTYTVTRTGPSFITFNYLGIDRATFDTTQQFALDNLTVAIPEPGLLPLFALGVVLGCLSRFRGDGHPIRKPPTTLDHSTAAAPSTPDCSATSEIPLLTSFGWSKDALDGPKRFISGKEPFRFTPKRDDIQTCLITCCKTRI